MFDYVVVLKGTNKKLAELELKSVWKAFLNEDITLKQIKNTFYSFQSSKKSIKKEILSKLTYTNSLGVLLMQKISYKNFEKNFTTRSVDSFAVEVKNLTKGNILEVKEVAKPIWNSQEKPKVNLNNPQEKFVVFYTKKDELYVTRKIFENEKDYLTRMPKLRVVAKPYTLKADLARGCVNLLGLDKGIVLDPFCGIGGILLEAYDLGFDVIGNDISWNDLQNCKKNFKQYYPQAKYSLILADARTQFLGKNTVDGIVTDVPYGKASRKLGLDLYEDFLKSAKIYLKPGRRLVLIYANFASLKKVALKYFNEIDEIDEYINKSMTRHVLILENTKDI